MRNGRYGTDPRLTREQERIRLQGLRLLARMIVEAHLASLIEKDARQDGSAAAAPTADAALAQGQAPLREGEHAG